MTRQDFEVQVITRHLRDSAMWSGNREQAKMLVIEWANTLVMTNPRFDRARFIDASTPPPK